MRYSADLTAGSLKVPESRIIADLLLRDGNENQWNKALYQDNVLQASNPATARRLAQLLRLRLQTMDQALWQLVRDGSLVVATHACLAAAVKHSALLSDFLDLVLREQYRLFTPALSTTIWERYIDACHARDPEMPQWRASTLRRLRSSVFHILAQAGYLESTRSLKLQAVHIAREVSRYLEVRDEQYVLRCIQVGP